MRIFIYLFVLLQLFISTSLANAVPMVCHWQDSQILPNYSLCEIALATWCGTNLLAATVISMEDPGHTCGTPGAHCVQPPYSPNGITPECTADSSGDPKLANCGYLKHSIPFELMTLSPNVTKDEPPIQYLLLMSQDTLSVTDMVQEKVILNQTIDFADNIINALVVSPTNFMNIAYIVVLTDTQLITYSATLYDSFDLQDCTNQVQGVLQIDTIYDWRSNTTWIMAQFAEGVIKFYRIDLATGCPDMENAKNWTLTSSDGSVNLTDIQTIQFLSQIEPNHTANVKNGCFPPITARTLVWISTSNFVFLVGFDAVEDSSEVLLNSTSPNLVFNGQYISSTTTISSLEIFGECFGNLGAPSQMLWLSVALFDAQTETSSLHLISLNEFSLHPFACDLNDPNWWLHPSSYRGGNCSFVSPACSNSSYYALNATSCALRTQSPTKSLPCSASTIIHRMQTAPYNTAGSGLTNVNAYVHLLFLQLSSILSISIYGFQEFACATTSSSNPFIMQNFNEILVGREINSMHISENGQHMFLSYARQYWEVSSRARLLEICTTLQNNSLTNTSDPFLTPYSPVCANLNPTPFNAYDYMIYYSECAGGASCWRYGNYKLYSSEDFNNTYVFVPNITRFAIRPTISYPCDPGYFCPGLGIRIPCLPGHTCPNYGQFVPTRCTYNANFDTTCIYSNLQIPAPCPDGMVCLNPTSAPVPAPPGYYVTRFNRTAFYECSPGDWCSLQRFNVSNDGDTVDLSCINGTSCSTSDVLVPSICKVEYNASFFKVNSYTEYCPNGTVTPAPCPAGNYCTTPSSIAECLETYYCPNGTQQPGLCPAGYYCPTPAEKNICPEGFYCNMGVTSPTKCHKMVVCPPGTAGEKLAYSGVLFDIGVVIVLLGIYYIAVKIRDKQREKRENERLSSPKEDFKMKGIQLKKKEFKIEFGFYDMGLVLNGSKKKVLDGVTGKIKPGRVTAVMGPSGAGKTTFLTTLAGKASYGHRTGTVLINGEPVDIEKYKKVLGFVPQEDVMHRELTVKEIIRFAADTRLPSHLSSKEKGEMVNAVISVLGLWDVRHQRIGDESTRGISGGQRKRVNIGMELVADPTVIFLDEPTSGLDSTSSEEVLSCLRDIADLGLTIVTVIHQPRYEIFQMFHDVLLLGKGGRTVYLGPSSEAMAYFESIGFTCPKHTNPPDFFMDVISGTVKRRSYPEFVPSDLFKLWEDRATAHSSPAAVADFRAWAKTSNGLINFGADAQAGPSEEEDISDSPLIGKPKNKKVEPKSNKNVHSDAERKTPGFFKQLLLFTVRGWVQQTRDMKGFFLDNALVFIAGSLLGALYIDTPYEGPVSPALAAMCPTFLMPLCELPQTDMISTMAGLVSLSIGFTAMTASLKCFGLEKVVFWREASSGVNKVAYFIGKNIAQLVNIVLAPVVFLSVFYTLTSPRAKVAMYYEVLLLVQFCFVGIGYLFSVLLPFDGAQLAGVVVTLVCAMLGGATPPPTLGQLQQTPLTLVISSMSPYRWSVEAIYIRELKRYSGIYDITTSYEFWGYNINNYEKDLLALLGIGMGARVLALFFLMVLHRDKMR